MALDFRPNFISAQYLEIYWTYFHQILYMHSYWQDVAWDWYISFFGNSCQSYGPLFTPKFCFYSISWEPMGRISPNFIYAFILARSSFGLLHIIFRKFVPSNGSLFTTKFRFRSISWQPIGRISSNFIYAFILTRSTLGLLHIIFRTFVPELWPLIYAKFFVSAQYLENKWTDFDQTLYNYLHWQDLHWDC